MARVGQCPRPLHRASSSGGAAPQRSRRPSRYRRRTAAELNVGGGVLFRAERFVYWVADNAVLVGLFRSTFPATTVPVATPMPASTCWPPPIVLELEAGLEAGTPPVARRWHGRPGHLIGRGRSRAPTTRDPRVTIGARRLPPRTPWHRSPRSAAPHPGAQRASSRSAIDDFSTLATSGSRLAATMASISGVRRAGLRRSSVAPRVA